MSRARLVLFSGLFAAIAAGSARPQGFVAKQVAAAPEDIRAGLVRLPDPASVAARSRGAWIPLEFVPDAPIADGRWVCEVELPVDADGDLALIAVGPDLAGWEMRARGPSGAWEPLDERVRAGSAIRRTERLEGPLEGWTGDRFDLSSVEAGLWRVQVRAPGIGRASRAPEGLLAAAGSGSVQLASHLTTWSLLADRSIGIAAALVDESPSSGRALAQSAEVVLETERGGARVAMEDDGLHADGAAGDGVLGALLPAGLSGRVRASVVVRGLTPEGRPLLRTTQHAFSVVERRAVLTGSVDTDVTDERSLALDFGAWMLGSESKVQLSAEVWASDAAGALVPVCWLSKMVVPEPSVGPSGESRLRMSLDGRWLNLAGASAPLELREVRLQDPGTHVPFDRIERLALVTRELPPIVGRPAEPIAPDMTLLGTSTGSTQRLPPHVPADFELAPRALMLVHGWCSGGNVWPAAHFSQPKVVFSDPDQNRTNDEFALLMAQLGQGLTTFGVVAHSQGGLAALHLLTYYETGLDQAIGNRRIQSVGAPYQGTPLASLGSFSCGVNDDMTPEGAALWLAGIPSWARAEVYYWTTSNDGSACNFFTNLFLASPNDGVIEQVRGQLPGGHSMGHVIGWCHTTGMSDPAQYTDATRNAEMNAQAAR